MRTQNVIVVDWLQQHYLRGPWDSPARGAVVGGALGPSVASSSSVMMLTRVPTARLTLLSDWNKLSTLLAAPPDHTEISHDSTTTTNQTLTIGLKANCSMQSKLGQLPGLTCSAFFSVKICELTTNLVQARLTQELS